MLDQEKCDECLHGLFRLCDKYIIQSTLLIVPIEVQEFFTKLIVLSKSETLELWYNALKQPESIKWCRTRRLQVSASKTAHSIKSRQTKSI